MTGGFPVTGVIVGGAVGPGLEPGVWTGFPPPVVVLTVAGVVGLVGPLAAVVLTELAAA
ncbi:MAG TPA: hypothetical protein VF895_05735 [Gaiellaceae bacterium]